jgi:predicted CopG family antitoxin
MSDITTIQVQRTTKEHLDDLKIIARESYDEVIQRLVKEYQKREA